MTETSHFNEAAENVLRETFHKATWYDETLIALHALARKHGFKFTHSNNYSWRFQNTNGLNMPEYFDTPSEAIRFILNEIADRAYKAGQANETPPPPPERPGYHVSKSK